MILFLDSNLEITEIISRELTVVLGRRQQLQAEVWVCEPLGGDRSCSLASFSPAPIPLLSFN